MSISFSLLAHGPLLNPKSSSFAPLRRPLPVPALATARFPSLKPSPSLSILRFPPPPRRREQGFLTYASKNGGEKPSETAGSVDEAEKVRGQSTMPERFRYLTKEAPHRPVRWPWLIVLFFLIYAWRTVLWELTNWKQAFLAIVNFLGYLLKLALAFIFHFIGDPITSLIQYIEFALYFARSIYSNIVAFAPVPELSRIILLTSTVLAIAEATVPDSVNSQPYLLTAAGMIGFGAVWGFVPVLVFWLLLCGLFSYSRFVSKRDGVSAALPSVAVLAAVGEPWVRVLAIISYLALAINQHSKFSERSETTGIPANARKPPIPLLLAALTIGIHIAAKWARHRHLTWMIA